MSVSKKRRPARWLRLERLESRSLLAGGIFDFTVRDLGHGKHERYGDTPVQVDHRVNHDQERGEQVIRNGDHAVQRRGQSGPPRDGRYSEFGDQRRNRDIRGNTLDHLSDHGQERNEGIFPEPVQGSALTPLNQTIGNAFTNSFAPPPRANTQPITFLVVPPVRSQSTSQESAEEPLTRPRWNEAQLVSVPAMIPDREPWSDDDVEETPTLDAVATVRVSEAFEAGEPDSLTSTEPALPRPPSNVTLIEPMDYGALVELSPLARWGLLDDNHEKPTESWELDRSILPRLRKTIEATSEEFAELGDAVVDQRSIDGGGMVAIDQVKLPHRLFATEREFVDVQVESTVMLYRSLEQFASTDLDARPPQLSRPILDSIMATLGEVAESEVQAVGDPSPSRLSAIAYPIAAVVASGAAFSARHRTKPLSTSQARKRSITI